ncbi:uncharacterized protein EDB93DRAFT_1148010 [Suillus bovinus]|uniref:uncharacterized protein n=1 Tax=Suillus bovinus TaxID=48563 RepID=UPI001B86DCE2|nr:uncharacterized protein EDB93DRAFT_1148010 [Suillus bovinus]KAG2146908.1 hypothetical protein EDB93DRAFT_1148010 [Suillus bovinus]
MIKSCAATLPGVKFSKLLQKCNIENLTALYWAIINNGREALLEFVRFIPKFSHACSSDLRLACMAVNDNDSFMLLHLGDINAKDTSLRGILGCPQDDIQVHEVDWAGHNENKFFVHFVFRMFQKRLRIAKKLEAEFVAQGRIWVLRFDMKQTGEWSIEHALSENSSPVRTTTELEIQANKPPSGSDALKPPRFHTNKSFMLVPEGTSHDDYRKVGDDDARYSITWTLKDWPMQENTPYVDRHGTLIAGLTITIRCYAR